MKHVTIIMNLTLDIKNIMFAVLNNVLKFKIFEFLDNFNAQKLLNEAILQPNLNIMYFIG